MTESQIKKQICDYLTAVGVFHRVVQIGGIRGRKNTGKGISDIIGVMPGGRALFIEVKTTKGLLSDEQRMFLNDSFKMGATAFVATSVQGVKDNIKKYGQLSHEDK